MEVFSARLKRNGATLDQSKEIRLSNNYKLYGSNQNRSQPYEDLGSTNFESASTSKTPSTKAGQRFSSSQSGDKFFDFSRDDNDDDELPSSNASNLRNVTQPAPARTISNPYDNRKGKGKVLPSFTKKKSLNNSDISESHSTSSSSIDDKSDSRNAKFLNARDTMWDSMDNQPTLAQVPSRSTAAKHQNTKKDDRRSSGLVRTRNQVVINYSSDDLPTMVESRPPKPTKEAANLKTSSKPKSARPARPKPKADKRYRDKTTISPKCRQKLSTKLSQSSSASQKDNLNLSSPLSDTAPKSRDEFPNLSPLSTPTKVLPELPMPSPLSSTDNASNSTSYFDPIGAISPLRDPGTSYKIKINKKNASCDLSSSSQANHSTNNTDDGDRSWDDIDFLSSTGIQDIDEPKTRKSTFPVATQFLESITRTPVHLKRSSSDNPNDESSPSKKLRSMPLTPTSSFVDNANTSIEEKIDPKDLCPYCDERMPSDPSPLLLNMQTRLRSMSYRDSRPGNKLGLKAPITAFITFCQRHRFESHLLPKAKRKGWPTRLNFETLPDRIAALENVLGNVIQDKILSVFWREIQADINKRGMRKLMGVQGQFATFDKSQPGYYGEQGSMIITQTLYNMFPPSSIDANLVAPLTPTDFIQRVLVMECALALIREDLNLDEQAAMSTLRESASFGVAMYPDMDKDDDVNDKILRERARIRRKEIEEEEKENNAMLLDLTASETDDHTGMKKNKGKNKDLGRGKSKKQKQGNNDEVEAIATEDVGMTKKDKGTCKEVTSKHASVVKTKPKPRQKFIEDDHKESDATTTEEDFATPKPTGRVVPRSQGLSISETLDTLSAASSKTQKVGRPLDMAKEKSNEPSWRYTMAVNDDDDDASIENFDPFGTSGKAKRVTNDASSKTHNWLLDI